MNGKAILCNNQKVKDDVPFWANVDVVAFVEFTGP